MVRVVGYSDRVEGDYLLVSFFCRERERNGKGEGHSRLKRGGNVGGDQGRVRRVKRPNGCPYHLAVDFDSVCLNIIIVRTYGSSSIVTFSAGTPSLS
jgi:hypothetical protein